MAQKEPLACLTGIVGVANTDCDCYETGRPEDYNDAASGLYLSSLVDLDALAQLYQCSGSTIWEAGAEAIREATLQVQANILQCWANKHKAREKWRGLVGERDCPQVLAPGATFAGLYIKPCAAITDGEMVISGIGTLFSQTGTVTVRVYDELTSTFLHEVDLDTTANTFQSNPFVAPIVLPFSRSDRSPRRYWILYTVSANKPKMGEVNCGCSSNQERMKEWAHIYGAEGNDVASRCDWNMLDHHFGLLPEVTFRCKVENGICDDGLDFDTNPNAMVIAEAIWFKASSLVPGKLRRSSKILPGTVLPSEDLKEEMQSYAAEAAGRIQALCSTMHPGSCYLCKTKARMVTMQ